ncbi:C40 family peptidase [Streptomyces griseocarneus]|uniref:C40 family peptidase n=1 Tax=Streptomyces griseocarneus TaxID=51201 RepID=UPI00167D3CD2|nr:C40 family peptidase [Streptomyces griseocarneus]MBZ6477036.1 C40 family peptidase [Streptomyces griseocarneus]GHG70087.1 hypothetical protein GCM10018779_43900 [Streptomyces griseocarneus]
MPEDIPEEGAPRRRRGAMRAALLAALGAAAIAGPGAVARAAEPPRPGPGQGADAATQELKPEDLDLADQEPSAQGPVGQDLPDQGLVEAEGAGAVPALEPALVFALRHVGDPYALGGVGPRRWDCSGLVQRAYARAGIRLPRLAADQYRATLRIPRAALRRGDLVFWSGNGAASGVHHVAIYLGDGRYVEAARPGTKVRISTFAHYNPHMYGRVTRTAAR